MQIVNESLMLSQHSWLFAGALPDLFFTQGYRFAGGYCSSVEPINKTPVTDSYFDTSEFFNNTPSFEGGPHWVSSYRSAHPGGVNVLFCDGSVSFISDSTELETFRDLSTIQGGEIVTLD